MGKSIKDYSIWNDWIDCNSIFHCGSKFLYKATSMKPFTILQLLTFTFFTLCLSLLGVIFYWINASYQIDEIKSISLPNELAAGEMYVVDMEVESRRMQIEDITISYVCESTTIAIPTEAVLLETYAFKAPSRNVTEQCHLLYSVVYRVNPLREIHKNYLSNSFTLKEIHD